MTQDEFIKISMETAAALGLTVGDLANAEIVPATEQTTQVVEAVATDTPVIRVGSVTPVKKTQSEVIGENITILQSSGELASDNKPNMLIANPYVWVVKSSDGKTYDEKGVYHLAHCKWSTGTSVRNVHKDSRSLAGSLKSAQKAGKADPTKKATFRIGAKVG